MSRRDFLQRTARLAGGCAFCLGAADVLGATSGGGGSLLVSPGCRTSKVRVAKVYLGKRKAHWPTPKLDLDAERARYEGEFGRQADYRAEGVGPGTETRLVLLSGAAR
jgi:hypothetical protein